VPAATCTTLVLVPSTTACGADGLVVFVGWDCPLPFEPQHQTSPATAAQAWLEPHETDVTEPGSDATPTETFTGKVASEGFDPSCVLPLDPQHQTSPRSV